MASYDILGNIAIVKFKRGTSSLNKKRFASRMMKQYPSVKTVLEKTEKFSGRLRTLKTKFISGEKTLESLYKENGCAFRLNVESCYFSPRLANERLELARQTKKGESVLVMFGGVAPFAIVMSKLSGSQITSVELGRDCSKYALDNVKRNKLQDKVKIIQGDVNRILPKLKEKFDRIVMARPNLKESFLRVAFPKAHKGTIIHYYGFYPKSELPKLKELINSEAKKAKRKIKILRTKEAGDIAPYTFRYRVDFKVLN